MSSAWLNIRIGLYHLIAGETRWYSVRISKNEYHKHNPKRFEVYTIKPFIY